MMPIGSKVAFLTTISLLLLAAEQPALAQFGPIFNGGGAAPGVYVEPDGTVKRREVDERSDLANMRVRAKLAVDAAKDEKLGFVSLPKSFAAAKEAIAADKPVPDEVRFLGGLTQIKFVFVYPETQDIVIAGPAEGFQALPDDPGYAVGMKTGRPVMRLEDLVVAMRVVKHARGAFGCRLDPDPAAPQRISDVMAKMARASRAARVKAVADATGPQKVSFFGGVPADTRFALTTVAADYELKRFGMGLARHTVPGLGSTVDNTRQAVSMIWFELAYDPILTSAEGDAYGLRGPRLAVQAGNFNWDPKGATPKAFEFAKKMSANIDAIAAQQPLIADLQNLADLSVVAALIQKDGLDRKVGWDTDWLVKSSGNSPGSFPVAEVVVPKEAVALANYTNGAIAAGGVVLSPAKLLQSTPETDEKKQLQEPKQLGEKLRKEKPSSAVVVQE